MATRAVFSAMTTTGARNAPVVTGHRREGRRATTHKVRIRAWLKDAAVFKARLRFRRCGRFGGLRARTIAGWGGV